MSDMLVCNTEGSPHSHEGNEELEEDYSSETLVEDEEISESGVRLGYHDDRSQRADEDFPRRGTRDYS